jgi:hypothetical protein
MGMNSQDGTASARVSLYDSSTVDFFVNDALDAREQGGIIETQGSITETYGEIDTYIDDTVGIRVQFESDESTEYVFTCTGQEVK